MTDPIPTNNDKAIQEFCAKAWWLILLRGIAVLVLGGMLVAQPGLTAVVLVKFLGAYFLVDGVFAVIKSVLGRKYMQGWGWGLIMGALEILTGIIIFGQPIASTIITATVLVYCVAFLAIAFGLLGVLTGIQVRKEFKGEWTMIANGVLAILFGVILIMNPKAAATVYLVVMGVLALIGGIIQILVSFKIRRIGLTTINA